MVYLIVPEGQAEGNSVASIFGISRGCAASRSVEEQTAALTYVREGRFHCALWGAITELGLWVRNKKDA